MRVRMRARHRRAAPKRGAHLLGILREEWAENRSFGSWSDDGVVHGVDESRETEDIGEENELLSNVGADLARRSEEVNGGPVGNEGVRSL